MILWLSNLGRVQLGNLLALSGITGEGTVIWSHGLELIALE